MTTNNETQPRKARSLAQIEEEMSALRKQKRSVISKQKKQQIDTLGKMAIKSGLSEQDMTELIQLFQMMKGTQYTVISLQANLKQSLSNNNQ